MKHTVTEQESPCLPQEIITNILIHLPVKSLIRFQCVCKHWKTLFKTQSFITKHLHHSTQQNPFLVIDWCISGCHPWHLSMFNSDMQLLEFHNNPHNFDPSIKGWVYSSNGLLCVELIGGSHHSIWLWNPSIGIVRLLPESPNNGTFNYFCVGFGFSPKVGDYSVVKLYKSDDFMVVEGEVYALSIGLWRKVEVGDLEGVHLDGRNFSCIGGIFWFGCRVEQGNEGDVNLIVSFDIVNEVFTLIPFPMTSVGEPCYYTLTSYENKLAMFSPLGIENSESYRITLWVLEECTDQLRERWSWTKLYTSRPNPYRFILCPEIIWRNEIVCVVEEIPERLLNEGEEEDRGEKVVFCNLTTDEFNMFDIFIPERQFSPEIFEYVESLVLMESEVPCLPQEIITDILARLPVKSLIRFRSVCKYWKNLFKTPFFISKHRDHSTQLNPLLVVDWYVSGCSPWHVRLFNRDTQFLEFPNPLVDDPSISGRVYSSYGLLCVELNGLSHHSVWLWNPSIRVVKPVPDSLNNYECDKFYVGFGFSPIVNDYYVVKIFMTDDLVVRGEVYALSIGLWRKVDVENLKGVDFLSGSNFSCIGAIFWFGCRVEQGNKGDVNLIVSFDILNEVFRVIPFPVTSVGEPCYYTLTSYENKLAMFSPLGIENSESYRITMWVLEECTDQSREKWSWTKLYTSSPNPYRFILCPEIIWRNEIVCTVEELPEHLLIEGEEEDHGEKVAFCNLDTNAFNMFDIPIRQHYNPEILEYVESLVLLDNIDI